MNYLVFYIEVLFIIKFDVQKYLKEEMNGEYILLSYYANMQTEIQLKHLICGNIIETNMANFTRKKTKCEKCRSRTLSSQTRFSYDKYMDYRQEFIDINKSIGRVLLASEILSSNNKYNIPSWNWFRIHCPNKQIQTYSSFLEWCDLIPRKCVTKEFISTKVIELHNKLNRYLTMDDISSLFHRVHIEKYWGGINGMRKALNLIQEQDMTDEYEKRKCILLSNLKNLINKLGKVPTVRDLKKYKGDIQTQKAFVKYFGTYNNALLSIGYEPNCTHDGKNVTNEEMVKQYTEFIDELGYVPSCGIVKDIKSLPAITTVKRRFNCTGWGDFIKLLGYEYDSNNNNGYGNICKASDGTICLSNSELAIHEYLLKNNIKIASKEYMYKNLTSNKALIEEIGNSRCDWIISANDKMYIVEFWGLMNLEHYKARHDKKIKFINQIGLYDNFISIYPEQLYNLDDVFKNIFVA